MSSRLRLALCLMIGAYPLVTLLLDVLAPLYAGWPLMARTALVVPPMVLGMVFGVMPLVHRLAGRWIAAGSVGGA